MWKEIEGFKSEQRWVPKTQPCCRYPLLSRMSRLHFSKRSRPGTTDASRLPGTVPIYRAQTDRPPPQRKVLSNLNHSHSDGAEEDWDGLRAEVKLP